MIHESKYGDSRKLRAIHGIEHNMRRTRAAGKAAVISEIFMSAAKPELRQQAPRLLLLEALPQFTAATTAIHRYFMQDISSNE